MFEINYKFRQKVERNGESRLLRGVFLLVRGNYAFCMEMHWETTLVRIYQVSPKTSDVTMTIHMSLRRLRNESFVDNFKIFLTNLLLTLIFCGRYYSPALLFAAAYCSPPLTVCSRLQLVSIYSSPSFTVRRRLQLAIVYSSPPFTVSCRLLFAAVYS